MTAGHATGKKNILLRQLDGVFTPLPHSTELPYAASPRAPTSPLATMSMDLANQLVRLLDDNRRMAELVGLGGDVEAAISALKSVETSEDLYQIYRTDVPIGAMSVRNLIAVLDERLQDLHSTSGHCRERIRMTNDSPHIASLHKIMAEKKKGSTEVKLYHPSSTSTDFEKALTEFQSVMGDNVKPKIENALKKGKGIRCTKLGGVCKPVISNSKKSYSPAQIAAAKSLMTVIRNI